MIMVLECQGTAEDNLSDVDQRIYEMYPHISSYEQDAETNEREETVDQTDFEVLADLDLPVVSEGTKEPLVTKTGGRSTVLSPEKDLCEVSCV